MLLRTLKPALFIFWFLFNVILLSTASGETESGGYEVSIEKRYQQAKFYFNELQTTKSISSSRDNWLKGTRNFRRIYLSSPKSSHAPACLYMLGRIYEQMYDRFHKGLHLEESISYYKDTARLFSKHRLADDAYFALGMIYLNKKNDPQNSGMFFSKVVTNYPNGDMHPESANMLKLLSKDHEIPLPKIMITSSHLNNLKYVLPVKYWSSEDYTRIVIMASGPVTYKEVLLEAFEDKPRRLYIDFKQSYIEPQYRAPVPIEDGLLRGIRTGQYKTDTVRVVLDIESIGSYKIFSLPDPFRVVIDVRGEKFGDQEQVAGVKSPTPPAQVAPPPGKENDSPPEIVILKETKKRSLAPQDNNVKTEIASLPKIQEFSLAQQLGLGVRTIVIDPGHGGKDPGAISNGIKEKDIVLAIAKQLAPALTKELGCKVILTRDDDTFIPLEERTAIANTHGADLFLSLHINAHPSKSVSGLETYYLNLSTNAEAMRVAARENATSTHQMSDLQDILSDILQNSKINESSRLANQVHQAILSQSISENNAYSNIKNLGVKQAPFYVLIGAQMPAILLEIGFISNKGDASNLTNQNFIDMIIKEISKGLRTYVNATSAQLTSTISD